MRRVLAALGILVLLLLGFASAMLAWGHLAIRREGAPVPGPDAVLAVGGDGGGPVRAAWIETARQPMPRSAVLDPRRDPDPTKPYVMSHPAFVLEWADGRLLLIDVGMTPEGARSFGKLLQPLSGAGPMEPLRSTAEQLGAARRRLAGIVFTHLHTDHVGGLPALCAADAPPIPVLLSTAQAERPNWTTRPGLAVIRDTPCARLVRLPDDGPLRAVPGFPGVAVFAAAGHTPGSQIVFARVGERRIAFVGDVVNHADGIRSDVPKPFLYSLLLVPEATGRLEELRVWLRDLADRHGVVMLPSHDEGALRASGLPAWSAGTGG